MPHILEHRRWAAALVALGAMGVQAATIAGPERAVADWIAKNEEAMFALLERSVKIDSATENVAGVKAVADLYAAELKAIGFTTRWAPLPEATKGAGHLFAERTGTRGKRLLLIGHLDTVLPGGMFSRTETTGRGSGVNDMKGGNVVLVFALKALEAAGALRDTQIVVAMTGDEESIRGEVAVSRRELIEAGKRSQVALAFETGRAGEATVARRGSSSWALEVTGPTGHSSVIFSAALGSGAVYETARIIEAFHSELRKLPGLTANVAVIAGGAEVTEGPVGLTAEGKGNVIPKRAVAQGDLRAISTEQLARAETIMREIVARSRPRTQARFTVSHRYPPMATQPRDLAVLAIYDMISRELGLGPVAANDPAQRGAGDSAFVAPYVAVLDGLGPYGSGAHADRESVDLASLVTQTTRAALLIYRLTR